MPSLARRLVAPPLLAVLLAWSLPATAIADHGGRPVGSVFACDRPVIPPRCTSVADNPRHLVFFDGTLTEELAAALRRTMAEDYGATKLVVIEQTRLTRMTDVIASSQDYGENGAAGWVYCPSDAPQGTNPSGDRWCRHQELHLNLNARYGAYFDDDASRDYVTCHEMGHTVGLRHWGNPPQTSGTDVGATCMNANTPDGPTTLHQYDIDHINVYAYRQRPWPGHRPLGAPAEAGGRQILPWTGDLQATEVESAGSLRELTRSADAVVRGAVVSVRPGRAFGGLHYAAATLRVDELIAGSLDARLLLLEIPLFDGPDSIERLPNWGEALFFVRNKGESARLAGESRAAQAADAPFHRLMSFSSLIVEDDGLAVTDPGSPLLAPFDGITFDEAVERVRAAGR